MVCVSRSATCNDYVLTRSECVRLKDFVTGAAISHNMIQNCGIYDYKFDGGEKNGEGIYIGTSSKQVPATPTLCRWLLHIHLLARRHLESSIPSRYRLKV